MNIVEGWSNYILAMFGLSDPHVETIAKERAVICFNCPFFDEEKIKCGKCGCKLNAKVRSLTDSCPIDKW